MKCLSVHICPGGHYTISLRDTDKGTDKYLVQTTNETGSICVGSWAMDSDKLRDVAKNLLDAAIDYDETRIESIRRAREIDEAGAKVLAVSDELVKAKARYQRLIDKSK